MFQTTVQIEPLVKKGIPKFFINEKFSHSCTKDWALILNSGINCSLGLIDSDYRGDIKPMTETKENLIMTYVPIGEVNGKTDGSAGVDLFANTDGKSYFFKCTRTLDNLFGKNGRDVIYLILPRSSSLIRYGIASEAFIVQSEKELYDARIFMYDENFKYKEFDRESFQIVPLKIKYLIEKKMFDTIFIRKHEKIVVDVNNGPLYMFPKNISEKRKYRIFDNFSHDGKFEIYNTSDENLLINSEMFLFFEPKKIPFNFIYTQNLDNTKRGTGGFGSTDV